MDLIRKMLLQIEASTEQVRFEKADEAYNAALLKDAGLIVGSITPGGLGSIVRVEANRLTWEGHEFLDSARNDTIWNKAKERIIKPGVSWTFAILGEFLKAEAQRQLASVLGYPPTP